MKKGRSKEEDKPKQGFPNIIKGWRRGWEIGLEEFWPFIAFIMLQIKFSNHWLIKITIICLYIKPEVKKMIQQQSLQMKLVLGDYIKIAIWWGGFFRCEKWGGILPPPAAFSPNSRFIHVGPYMMRATRKIKGGEAFLVRGIQLVYFREIILLDTVLY